MTSVDESVSLSFGVYRAPYVRENRVETSQLILVSCESVAGPVVYESGIWVGDRDNADCVNFENSLQHIVNLQISPVYVCAFPLC